MPLTLYETDTWLELNRDGDGAAEAVIILTCNHTADTAHGCWLL